MTIENQAMTIKTSTILATMLKLFTPDNWGRGRYFTGRTNLKSAADYVEHLVAHNLQFDGICMCAQGGAMLATGLIDPQQSMWRGEYLLRNLWRKHNAKVGWANEHNIESWNDHKVKSFAEFRLTLARLYILALQDEGVTGLKLAWARFKTWFLYGQGSE